MDNSADYEMKIKEHKKKIKYSRLSLAATVVCVILLSNITDWAVFFTGLAIIFFIIGVYFGISYMRGNKALNLNTIDDSEEK